MALIKPRDVIFNIRGTKALILKYIFLALLDSIAIWVFGIMIAQGSTVPAFIMAAAVLALNFLYLTKRAVPAKYIVPGTITMLAFSVIPIVYTVYIAFTNYSNGHVYDKAAAIERITSDGYTDIQDYLLALARDENGDLVYLLAKQNIDTGEIEQSLLGRPDGISELPEPLVFDEENFVLVVPDGYTGIPDGDPSVDLDKDFFKIELDDGSYIVADSFSTAWQRKTRYAYDETRNVMLDVENNITYTDNGRGSFATDDKNAEVSILEPGWIAPVGLSNFSRIITDENIRRPFVRVFIWTIVFALSTVLLTFALGLALALLFNDPRMRGRKVYRSLLIIPYAIPSLLSILVWAGLLNDRFGPINQTFGLTIPWLQDPTWAKIAVLLVNLWLGFPYMFLVSTGALQSIPSELREAAEVDGATKRQTLRQVIMPLLLVAVGPLLVSSFAYNFNNFNLIRLLTDGGPALNEAEAIAGGTDILISYTYKLAFAGGKGNDYGLASAISIMIFFIVGSISFWSFRRSKALENMQ